MNWKIWKRKFKPNKNFWQDLKHLKKDEPILVMAPMADVTDYAFRKMFSKYGKPDVLWTEFVSADGLALAPEEGRERLIKDLDFNPKYERPIIAQIFSSNPEYMKEAATLVENLGFDGVDINMGCPAKKIVNQLSGSAMIKYPENAVKVIKATMEGAPTLPVSVKTRLGYNHDQLEEWLPTLLTGKVDGKDVVDDYQPPKLITLHARTQKDLSKVSARWERIKRAVEIRDEIQKDLAPDERTLIFGNGDVDSIKDAYSKWEESGCDGVMIGRGLFGKPWLFNKKYFGLDSEGIEPTLKQRLKILVEHTKTYEKYVQHKNFAVMKKHFKAYAEGFDGAKELRIELMETENAREVEKVVNSFIKKRRL